MGAGTRRVVSSMRSASSRCGSWPPGASEAAHVHEEDQALEEIYYFLSGDGTMWADREEFSTSKIYFWSPTSVKLDAGAAFT